MRAQFVKSDADVATEHLACGRHKNMTGYGVCKDCGHSDAACQVCPRTENGKR